MFMRSKFIISAKCFMLIHATQNRGISSNTILVMLPITLGPYVPKTYSDFLVYYYCGLYMQWMVLLLLLAVICRCPASCTHVWSACIYTLWVLFSLMLGQEILDWYILESGHSLTHHGRYYAWSVAGLYL